MEQSLEFLRETIFKIKSKYLMKLISLINSYSDTLTAPPEKAINTKKQKIYILPLTVRIVQKQTLISVISRSFKKILPNSNDCFNHIFLTEHP